MILIVPIILLKEFLTQLISKEMSLQLDLEIMIDSFILVAKMVTLKSLI